MIAWSTHHFVVARDVSNPLTHASIGLVSEVKSGEPHERRAVHASGRHANLCNELMLLAQYFKEMQLGAALVKTLK